MNGRSSPVTVLLSRGIVTLIFTLFFDPLPPSLLGIQWTPDPLGPTQDFLFSRRNSSYLRHPQSPSPLAYICANLRLARVALTPARSHRPRILPVPPSPL